MTLRNDRKSRRTFSTSAAHSKSQFLSGKYPKKANEIGIAEYEAENFKLHVTPHFAIQFWPKPSINEMWEKSLFCSVY